MQVKTLVKPIGWNPASSCAGFHDWDKPEGRLYCTANAIDPSPVNVGAAALALAAYTRRRPGQVTITAWLPIAAKEYNIAPHRPLDASFAYRRVVFPVVIAGLGWECAVGHGMADHTAREATRLAGDDRLHASLM